MSVATATSGLLSIMPTVRVEGHQLIAQTSAVWRGLSLFGYDRRVTVCKRRREVVINTKSWFVATHPEVIPFDRIDEIDRSLDTLPTKWFGWQRGQRSHTQDQFEFYKVSLFLREPHETIDLFWFMGEGAVETGLYGSILLGDDLVDLAGKQKASSQEFAELLHRLTGARIHNFAPKHHYPLFMPNRNPSRWG